MAESLCCSSETITTLLTGYVVVQWPSCAQLFATPWTAAPQASLSPGVNSYSYPLSRWCHPTSSFSVTCLLLLPSFPASGSFPMSQLFASGGHSIEVSASVSVLPMNIQGWFPLGLTSLISLQSKGLSRVFSNTTVQKLSLLHSPTLTSIHDHWKNHSLD